MSAKGIAFLGVCCMPKGKVKSGLKTSTQVNQVARDINKRIKKFKGRFNLK